jgi:NhaA family Na+:H+ antiporter
MLFATLQRLFRHEAASGIVLMLTSALALVLANSPMAGFYDLLLSLRGSVRIGSFGIEKPLLLWVNDGLMAIFFLLVGLEIKREVLAGQLCDRSGAILPAAAAIGGMVVPALIYLGVTWHAPGAGSGAASGWAIPAATDIAFSLGVIALLGSRVPTVLKLFLTALAIIDDLGAIVVIAIFYTEELAGVRRIVWYVLVGLVLWVFVLKSGVHATLAGVALALAIPFEAKPGEESPLIHVEHELAPWVAFGILPLLGCPSPACRFPQSWSRFRSPSPPACFSGSRSVSLAARRWSSAPAGRKYPRTPTG